MEDTLAVPFRTFFYKFILILLPKLKLFSFPEFTGIRYKEKEDLNIINKSKYF